MRILFFENSPVWNYLLPAGFSDAGHEVMVSGHLHKEGIPRIINEFKPHLIITMGWSQFQWENYQEWLGKYIKKSGIPHVYWSLEDPEHTFIFVLPLLQRVNPDFVFTICSSKVNYFKKLGYRASLLEYGYNPQIHFPAAPNPKYKCNVAVVANAYDHILKENPGAYRTQCLENLIKPLIRNNIRIDFWGSNWDKMGPILGLDIPLDWIHGSLDYLKTAKVYSNADIVIGLQNNYTQFTQRVFEVLASGGFLITCDNHATRERFTPGDELIVSSSPQETLSKVKYFLDCPKERKIISENGRLSVIQDTYKARAQQILNILKSEKVI